MKRNQNIEMIRGGAILFVLIYHYYILSMTVNEEHIVFLLENLAQMTMFCFFLISGFGTWNYFERKKCGESASRGFFVYRIKKLAPAYYFCIFLIILVITPKYFSSEWKAIPVYLLFLQNVFPQYSGEINGASWTIALFVQFYLVAPWLYKLFSKITWRLYPIAVVFSTMSKIFLAECIARNVVTEGDIGVYYVIAYIRQLPTTIDHFVAGMCVGYFLKRMQDRKQNTYSKIVLLFLSVLPILAALAISWKGMHYFQTVWIGTVWPLIWPPVFGVCVAISTFLFAQLRLRENGIVQKVLLRVSRYEYNIYLWHMILFTNIYNTELYQKMLLTMGTVPTVAVMVVIACLFGYAITAFLNPKQSGITKA